MDNMDNQDTTYSKYDLTQDRPHKGIDRPRRPSATGIGDDAGTDAKQEIKEKVSNAIGIVAGAVEGFVETLRDSHLAELSKEGIELVGDTVHNVVAATREQVGKTVEAFQGEGSIGDKADMDRDLDRGSSFGSMPTDSEGPASGF